VPSDRTFHLLNGLHRLVVRATRGRMGWRAARMPVVELTTTGRRSGKAHTLLLTSPVQDGDTVVLVASRWGDDHHPAWFLNLRDHPEVEAVVAGGPRRAMTARVATPEERAALWPRATAVYPGYAQYQAKTTREIPLVLLEPR